MAQNYVVMARKNLLKPDETPKYYAVARSGRKVTVKEVCKRISERSSYSKGELEGCIGEFLLEIVNVLDEGKIMGVGTSEELLATNEIYRLLYESQVKGGEDDE